MAVRPSQLWREHLAEDARMVAAGELTQEEAAETAELFPESLLVRTDEVLATFETDLAALDDPSDEAVFAAIERVVSTLNMVNEEFDEAAYETGEREELCAYIVEALTDAGIDVDALAARRGLTRHEITDEWREW